MTVVIPAENDGNKRNEQKIRESVTMEIEDVMDIPDFAEDGEHRIVDEKEEENKEIEDTESVNTSRSRLRMAGKSSLTDSRLLFSPGVTVEHSRNEGSLMRPRLRRDCIYKPSITDSEALCECKETANWYNAIVSVSEHQEQS